MAGELRSAKMLIRCVLCLLLCVFHGYLIAQSAIADTAILAPIVVEDDEEPEAPLPLGIGISGNSLRTSAGAAGDPVRALQSLPGFNYASDEEAVPAVRGSRPDDNLFLTDFAPSSYVFHVGGAISVFNADLVKTFNIYPSAYGPEYTGVTGGVFDIELREPKTDKFHTTVDVSIFQAGMLVEGPLSENQSFYLAGRFSYLDLLLADQIPEEDGVRIDQFPKYYDYQGKYVWKLSSDNKLTVQINGASDENAVFIDENSPEIDNDPIFAGTISEQTSFDEQAIVWDSNPSDLVSLKSIVSHGYSDEQGTFGGAGEIDVSADTWVLKSRATIMLGNDHDLTLGGEFRSAEADIDIDFSLPSCSEFEPDCILTGAQRLSTSESTTFDVYHAYIKDAWYLTDKLALFPGIAYRRESRFDKDILEPRLAAEYALTERTLISAGLGMFTQAPGYLESNAVFGNPDIENIKSVHGSLGIKHTFSDGWSVKSEVFYKALDNLVTSDDVLNYTNDGEGKTYGFDTLVRKNLTEKLSGWLSVSLSESRREDTRSGESFVFDYDQPFNVSLVGSYKINDKWTIGTKLWAHSGTPYTPVTGAQEDENTPGFFIPEYAAINSARLPSYQRLDVRVDRAFKTNKGRKINAWFELLNVLGKENAASYDYNSDYTEREIVPQLEGLFSMGFKASF